MVHSAVGESFSFPDSKFKHAQSEKETEMVGDSELDENTVIFSDKMDVSSDKSSESTICGSNSNTSVVADSQLTKEIVNGNAEDAQAVVLAQDTSKRICKKEVFSKCFKYVSTETTVINSTYNVISQSAVRGIKTIPSGICVPDSNPVGMVTDDAEKSRVVVQILTSNTKNSVKSQNVTEKKHAHTENQSVRSEFRDDVYKILSKSQSSIFNPENKSKEDIQISDTRKNYDSNQRVSAQIKSSTKIVRTHRKRSLKSYFLFGRGPKISDIENVSTYLQTATRKALRIVHYVLYDKYGPCNNELEISQTRKNISRFCGYPFDQNSEEYEKRANCLKKIPLPILYEVHEAFFGKTTVNSRMYMVEQLMEFFLMPKRYKKIVGRLKQDMKFMFEEEYNALKDTAVKGSLPSVVLQKLQMGDVERIKNELKMAKEADKHKTQVENENIVKEEKSDFKYLAPGFILEGPGKKLKYFPAIVKNVKNANANDVSLLHYILYGREESRSVVCRRNILEFSGYQKCQTKFLAERQDTLMGLDKKELCELCNILCLRGRTNSRSRRIEKIMEYLQAPSKPVKRRGVKRNNFFRVPSESEPVGEKCFPEPVLDESEKIGKVDGWRLRDFKKICSNIECSAPSDLTELHDLLFMKPCDETDIHEKILNFTRFGFPSSSFHYHCRKTLMFYMGPCIVHKIAKLLDIGNWDIASHEDLSSSILNFLMENKSPNSPRAKSSLSKSLSGSSLNVIFPGKQELQVNNLAEVHQHQTDEAIPSRKENLYIHRLSKLSVETNVGNSSDNALVQLNIERRNDIFSPIAISSEDDSVPLRVFIHHPTDEELKQVINAIIKDNLWHSTLGDLVKGVYQCYPEFNLAYRESFIKTEARQLLSELRSNAVNVVKQMNLSQLSQ